MRLGEHSSGDWHDLLVGNRLVIGVYNNDLRPQCWFEGKIVNEALNTPIRGAFPLSRSRSRDIAISPNLLAALRSMPNISKMPAGTWNRYLQNFVCATGAL